MLSWTTLHKRLLNIRLTWDRKEKNLVTVIIRFYFGLLKYFQFFNIEKTRLNLILLCIQCSIWKAVDLIILIPLALFTLGIYLFSPRRPVIKGLDKSENILLCRLFYCINIFFLQFYSTMITMHLILFKWFPLLKKHSFFFDLFSEWL